MKTISTSIKAILPVITALAFGQSIQANVIHVPTDQPTIAAGIAAANEGDTVLVTNGTYQEHDIAITKDITVTSVSGATNTVIDMQSLGRGFIVTGASLTNVNISGFTIQNATIPYADGGGSVLVNSGKCQINNCIIQGNSGSAAYGGGPIDNKGINVDDVLVSNCTIRNNFAANGCGLSLVAAYKWLLHGS